MAVKSLIETVRILTEKNFDHVLKHRRTIHANPELSSKEFQTSEYITSVLDGLNIHNFKCTETGVVGIIGKGEPCVALRADIDALPIEEETGLPFSSQNSGVMHACGHDMHTAMLLGAAEVLKSMENDIKGTVKLIFQPSEELLPGGAIQMIGAGVLENPRPSCVFGQHIDPAAVAGTLSFAPGPVMASSDELYWTLRGKGSHAAQPHLGNDPIIAASALVQHFQAMINKYRNPLNPAVLSVTAINGGSATNIFPDEVSMKGTLRTFDDKLRNEMHKLIENQSKTVCSLYNVDCEIEIKTGYPPLVNDPHTVSFVKEKALHFSTKELVLDFEPKMWAEDFAYFAKEVPSVFWFLGAKPNSLATAVPLHNPKLNPTEDAMKIGVGFFAFIALEALEKLSMGR